MAKGEIKNTLKGAIKNTLKGAIKNTPQKDIFYVYVFLFLFFDDHMSSFWWNNHISIVNSYWLVWICNWWNGVIDRF